MRMFFQFKQHCATSITTAFTVAMLSACGAGPVEEGTMPDEPSAGLAIESAPIDTSNQSPQAAQQPPNTETTQAPTVATDTTPLPIESEPVDPSTSPILTVEPAPTPEPTPIPLAEVELEPIPETTAETEPETIPEITIEPTPIPQPPTSVSCTTAASNMQASALYFINQARSVARMCGDESFAAAAPVAWNAKLEDAARIHSEDMAQHNFFSHTGSDGLSSSQRASNQGYDWRIVGENIAAGQPTTETVIQDWIDSPGHCANIMNPSFKEIAVVCVENNASQYRQYWTNALGSTF